MLLYKKLLLLTFGTTLVTAEQYPRVFLFQFLGFDCWTSSLAQPHKNKSHQGYSFGPERPIHRPENDSQPKYGLEGQSVLLLHLA